MRLLLFAVALSLVATTTYGTQDYDSIPEDKPSSIQFVTSTPVESELSSEFASTSDKWLELIRQAESSLDLAYFYASDRGPGGDLPAEQSGQASKLTEIVEALEQAAERGIAIRLIGDSGFAKTYPALLARLDAVKGIDVAQFDMRALTGGVMHAKYMIADNRRAYSGSANFDWRSLEHIQELGLLVQDDLVAQAMASVFAMDWKLAGGAPNPEPLSATPEETTSGCWHLPPGYHIALPVFVTPVCSPKSQLPDGVEWDLPQIIDRIQNAEKRVWIQVMTFRMKAWDGEVFDELLDAILDAARRDVDVRILVADWGKRPGTIEGLQELSARDDIQVRMVTVPEHKSGHIPFGRVIHAKFMVVDHDQAWVGSSNWEKDYFYESRNVGFMLYGHSANTSLANFYMSNWKSPHTYEVDPKATYEVPLFGERE